jgi:hypothetical protein
LFPENFFVMNPQFSQATLNSNPGSSTYHSFNVQVTKRLAKGFTSSTIYTWSRAIGENDADAAIDYRDPHNERLNKAVLGFHRTHIFNTNGTYELPFGPGRALLSNTPGWLQRMVERWQLGGILNLTSGAPFSVTALVSTLTQATSVSTPNIVGSFPKSMGKVTRLSNGVTFLPGIQQIPDPAIASVSTDNGLQGSFSNKAITDAAGSLLLVAPGPGQIGNMGLRYLEGPGSVFFNVDLIKRVRIAESKEFEFRVDAINVLNRPNFAAPTADTNSGVGYAQVTTLGTANINSPSFGRILSSTGERSFVFNGRFNF